jgi:hypothetical protein
MNDLELKLTRLSFLKRSMADYKVLEDEFKQLKFEVLSDMQAAKSDKTQPTAGIFGTIARRTVPTITDPEALEHWLIMTGYAEQDYLKTRELDPEKIAGIAAQELEKQGEIAPGFELRTTESLSIRAAK